MRANNSDRENNHLKLTLYLQSASLACLLTRQAEGRTVTLRAVPSSIPGLCWEGMHD